VARSRRRRARRGQRVAWKVAVLALASITIITLDVRGDLRGAVSGLRRAASDAVSPLTGAVDDVLHPIGSFLAGAVNYGALAQQNAKLRLELRRQEGDAEELRHLQTTIDQLTALDHLPSVDIANIPTVVAEVSGASPSNFAAAVVLDKGTADGVGVGMPVVDGLGLVGQVVSAAAHQATVQLVTDPRSVVPVTYGSSGALASVDGTGPGSALSVEYVAPRSPLHRGMVLTTAPNSPQTYPVGIPVAKITSFHAVPTATSETVSATPVAQLGDLGYVDVLQWLPPG
jgi:rod shape-determining protein MreC